MTQEKVWKGMFSIIEDDCLSRKNGLFAFYFIFPCLAQYFQNFLVMFSTALEGNTSSLFHIHIFIYSMIKDFTFSSQFLCLCLENLAKIIRQALLSPTCLPPEKTSSRDRKSLYSFKGSAPQVIGPRVPHSCAWELGSPGVHLAGSYGSHN